ncbi:N-acetyl-D-Glu racemase DgcA [Emcibacter sp. SYSU 3D8]|uniref:N-acetyl-D-Glu racemase DgcA n=1 Tax=Emcibacter sp. SYSU 3D8 TaxID=3133969 RepID=UPI0031FE4DEB
MIYQIRAERWPVAGVFRISRRSATETDVVVVEVQDGGFTGRGECGPNVRYGESAASVTSQLEGLREAVEAGIRREVMQARLPHGAARNALDCALWDLDAKRSGTPAWRLAGRSRPGPLVTAFTLSIDTPENLLAAAGAVADRPLLKIKLAGDEHDLARIRAVNAAAPQARLIVDANEALTIGALQHLAPLFAGLRVDLIEQPLPAGKDDALRGYSCPVPLCADESLHTRGSLDDIAGKYQAVNIKLDKAGGLTEALATAAAARERGLKLMVGCMLGTSLAMAPAMLVAQDASWVDLDGPLLLAKDRENGIRYDRGVMQPADTALWG